jgi:hypothetical protein
LCGVRGGGVARSRKRWWRSMCGDGVAQNQHLCSTPDVEFPRSSVVKEWTSIVPVSRRNLPDRIYCRQLSFLVDPNRLACSNSGLCYLVSLAHPVRRIERFRTFVSHWTLSVRTLFLITSLFCVSNVRSCDEMAKSTYDTYHIFYYIIRIVFPVFTNYQDVDCQILTWYQS